MSEPTSSKRSWRSEVDKADPGRYGSSMTYHFSNNRVFRDRDDAQGAYEDRFDEYTFDFILA